MGVFEKSKWIWIKDGGGNDEYGDFYTVFEHNGGKTVCNVSVDGDYTLFVNGRYVASNQFGDFEHYKNYDTVDITDFLKTGKNEMYVLVWHFGKISMRYRPASAGLIFEVVNEDKVIAFSDENVRSRKNKCYESGRCKNITGQLGLGFAYDANNEDNVGFVEYGLDESITVDKKCRFVARVGEKMRLADFKSACLVKSNGKNHYLLDLGEETVGLPSLSFVSESKQKVTVAWGEHIKDGCVRRQIGGRDFSFEYTAKPGRNDYTNYMLRLGLRYIEIFAEKPVELVSVGVLPQYYPVAVKNASFDALLDKRIYDLCVKTLQLSMMEHYVDCPWREQCLYVFDSRNQMLCGYYAFENGNAEYVRANLKLIMNDTRADGLLSITYPSGNKLAIPSFSLHFYTSLREYYEHTGDSAILKEAFPKIISVMDTFVANRENGLLKKFDGEDRWNFYDWSDNLSGSLGAGEATAPDLVCNCLFIRALSNLKFICSVIGEEFKYEDVLKDAFDRTREAFFEPETGLFVHTAGTKIYTALGNALAITCGLCSDIEAKKICAAIVDGTASECSLSLKPFVYDALFQTDEFYKEFILTEIRNYYGKMLDEGATSAWETIKGAEDFGNAGSLCHGWSSIPIYYYHKFGMVKE